MALSRWRRCFLEGRLDGTYARHQGRRRSKDSLRLEARILKATMQPPKGGTSHWSARQLAAKLGINHMQVARTWQRAGLQRHRVETYVDSNDPDFEAKALDMIGLYLNPPQHSIVFSVDEKPRSKPSTEPFQSCPFRPAAPDATQCQTLTQCDEPGTPGRGDREPPRMYPSPTQSSEEPVFEV